MKATALVALLVVGAEGLALEDVVSEPRKLPPVPKVFNAGPDGMPQLPRVDRLLKDYQDVKHNLNSQATSFADHLNKVEHESLQHIAKKRAAFDAKLRAQEKLNQAVVHGNAHLAKEILVARQTNTELKKQVKKTEKLISFRRAELEALEQQLTKSAKFVHHARETGDPTQEVSFLHMEKEPPTEAPRPVPPAPAPLEVSDISLPKLSETPEKELDTSAESDAVSFLEVSRHLVKRKAKATKRSLRFRRDDEGELPALDNQADDEKLNLTGLLEGSDELPPAPAAHAEDEPVVEAKRHDDEDKIIDELTSELRQLHDSETRSEANLLKLFHNSFEAGKKRHVALLEQQTMLRKELIQTTKMTSQLKETAGLLKAKLNGLEENLKQGGHFLADLEKVAAASVKEVPALLKAVSAELPA